MAERIFDPNLVEIPQRDPAKRYKYKTHPVTRENCYVEFTSAEETARTADEAAFLVEQAKPKPKTDSEKIADLEARLAAVETKVPK